MGKLTSKLIVIRIILSLFLGSSAHAINFGGELNLPSKEATQTIILGQSPETIEGKLERAKQEASAIFERLTLDETYRAGFLHQRGIEQTNRLIPKLIFEWNTQGEAKGQCSPNTLAYAVRLPTPYFRNRVFLCPHFLVQTHEVMVQIIIHEASHLALHTNECQATSLEVLAMHYSTYLQAYKSPYWSQCSTKKFANRLKDRLSYLNI